MKRYATWLLLLPLACVQWTPVAIERPVKPLSTRQSKKVVPAKKRVKRLTNLVPLGPKGGQLYLKLKPLGRKESVPQVRQATGALAAIPPSYFSLSDGRLMGFAACNGKVLSYYPLESRRTDRVLVLIRRRPQQKTHNVFYVKPTAVRRVAGKGPVTARAVKRLGISLQKFDVVTMHLNNCVVPDAIRERSGLIAGRDHLKLFDWSGNPANRKRVNKYVPPGGTVLFGDGGETLSRPKARNPKVALLAYNW